jgi:hypothetical protein
MLSDLRRVAERADQAEPDDFRGAAGALLAHQFLFVENAPQRAAYRLVVEHFDYFNNLFDALGWTLHRDDDFGFVGVVPTQAEAHVRLRLQETLFLLTLRLLYEEGMDRFQAQHGSVWVDGEDILGRYETLVRRERPKRTDFHDILARLARHGLIERRQEEEQDLPRVRILPSIRVVTGEEVLKRLEGYVSDVETAEDDLEGPGDGDWPADGKGGT